MNRPARSPGCLHFVLRPHASALQDCLASCAAGDAVVLMDAAVALAVSERTDSAAEVEFFCLEADVRARGLGGLITGGAWTMVAEHELVRMVMQFEHCLSWK